MHSISPLQLSNASARLLSASFGSIVCCFPGKHRGLFVPVTRSLERDTLHALHSKRCLMGITLSKAKRIDLPKPIPNPPYTAPTNSTKRLSSLKISVAAGALLASFSGLCYCIDEYTSVFEDLRLRFPAAIFFLDVYCIGILRKSIDYTTKLLSPSASAVNIQPENKEDDAEKKSKSTNTFSAETSSSNSPISEIGMLQLDTAKPAISLEFNDSSNASVAQEVHKSMEEESAEMMKEPEVIDNKHGVESPIMELQSLFAKPLVIDEVDPILVTETVTPLGSASATVIATAADGVTVSTQEMKVPKKQDAASAESHETQNVEKFEGAIQNDVSNVGTTTAVSIPEYSGAVIIESPEVAVDESVHENEPVHSLEAESFGVSDQSIDSEEPEIILCYQDFETLSEDRLKQMSKEELLKVIRYISARNKTQEENLGQKSKELTAEKELGIKLASEVQELEKQSVELRLQNEQNQNRWMGEKEKEYEEKREAFEKKVLETLEKEKVAFQETIERTAAEDKEASLMEVSALHGLVGALEEEASKTADISSTLFSLNKLSLSLHDMEERFESYRPINTSLEAFKSVSVNDLLIDAALATISSPEMNAACNAPLPNTYSLQKSFNTILRGGITAAFIPNGGGILQHLIAYFFSLLYIFERKPINSFAHKIKNQEDQTERNLELLSALAYFVDKGNFFEALEVAEQLDGLCKVLLREWVASVRLSLTFQLTFRVLSSRLACINEDAFKTIFS